MIVTELSLLPLSFGDRQISICDGQSVFVGGADQTQAGFYVDTLTGSNGCDSILTTELIVLPNVSSDVLVEICEGESYLAGGTSQTASGTYFDTLVASNGCDSVVITTLIVKPILTGNQQITICEGESVFIGGADQTESGFYNDTVLGSNGCDSILTTELIVLPVSNGTAQVSICEGESYFAGGADQTQSGFYVDTLAGSDGCDSILTTELIVLLIATGNTQVSICEGESFFVGGADQTEAGFYVDTLTGMNGCDSLLTTELIVIPPSSGNATVSICAGESIFVGGADQTEAGFYVDTLTGGNGCDSILTTEVIVLPNSSSSQTANVCNGDGFFAGGSFQTTSGTYFDTLTAVNGCDSIVTTILNVGEELQVSFDVNHISCGCVAPGTNPGIAPACTLNFAGLPHGTVLDDYFASLGVTISANANGIYPDQLIVFNTNLTNTPDPDLQVGIGNAAIFPMNLNDSNHDGIVDSPNDQGAGGAITFTFDNVRTVYGITLVDNDKNGGSIKAYDENNNLITTVNTPSNNDPVQNIALNMAGVKTLTVTYSDSRAITNIIFSCPPQTCLQDISGYAHGEIVTGEEIAPGVFVTGTSNTPNQFPNAVAIFNSNVSGSLDPDLEVGIGNLLILPQYLTDNNNDGSIDNPSDASNGGKMTFTFDRDRTVYSITLVDNDRNNGTIKAFDANNMLLRSVSTPSGAPNSIQVYNINVSGVRKLEVNYWDSRGVTNLLLDCPLEECCDGNATASANGGFPPYSFAWSTGSNVPFSGDSLCEGTYYVTITDQLGCSTVDSVTIGQSDANYTTQSFTICEGDSILLAGEFQTESGTYHDTLGATDGCFDVLVSELTIIPATQTAQQVSICEGESFFAGGAEQTESGIYQDVFVGANGCDSVVTTELTVLPAASSTQQVSICEVKSFFAGGDDQTESGTYFDTLIAANGCDSVVTTELTVLPAASSTQQVSICEGESFFAGGADQTETGTYVDTLTAANGCDSIVTTGLTVLPVSSSTQQVSICEGESFFAGGADQTETGTYVDTLTAANGCDSIVTTGLTVLPVSSSTQQVSICEGQSYFAGGADQTETGTYFDTLTAANGCDSIVTTELTVLPISSSTQQVSICEGESFFAGGADQTETGTYVDTLTAANGCDSIVTTELTVLPISFSAQQVSICEGETFFAGGADQSEPGTYFDTLSNADGCDSILTTELTVNPSYDVVQQISICEGDSFFAGGAFQTQAGVYIDSFVTAFGCDSIVATTLDVVPSIVFNQQIQICEGESFFIGGADQSESGTYFDTLTASGGCDSVVVTELIVIPTSITNDLISICEGESYFAGGADQTETGTYFDTLTSSNGCDSIVVTELTVLPVASFTQQVSICEGESYFAGGADQTESGTYLDTLTAANGCDSVLTTELTVLAPVAENVQVQICEGETYFAGGDFQTESGTYFDTLIATNGCDSILTTVLTVVNTLLDTAQVTICEGDSLFVGGAFQTQGGTYTDTFTSTGGCDSVVVTELTVNSLDLLTESAVTNVSCFGASDGLINLTVLNGTPSFQYAWSHGSVKEDPAGLTAGNYSVTVVDANGCEGSQSFTITQPAPLALGGLPTPVSCNGGNDGAIDLTVFGGTPGYTFLWSTGETTEDIFNRPAGNDTVTVTDANGCQATVIVIVGEPDSLTLSAIVSDESNPGANDGAIDLTIAGGTSPYIVNWSTADTSQDLTNLAPGFYFVTVADANGCEVFGSFEVIAAPIRQFQLEKYPNERFEVRVFPNTPVREWIYVEVDATKERNGFLIIHDLMGKKVLEEKVEIKDGLNNYRLHMGTLAEGIYIMEVRPEGSPANRVTRLIFKE